MDAQLLDHCEKLAKAGQISLVVELLHDEIVHRLTRNLDPNIDLSHLIISAYNPAENYSVKDFITVLVSILNTSGVKAKQSQ